MMRERRWGAVLEFVVVGALGVLLHFLYDWSGQNVAAALVSAVNESIWEHMKLLYVARMLCAVVRWRLCGRPKGFWRATAAGTWCGVLAIPVLYYTYTGALGVSADWFNIAIYFLAAGVAQMVQQRRRHRGCGTVSDGDGVASLLLLGGLFALFTFTPPRIPLFCDPVTGAYGRA